MRAEANGRSAHIRARSVAAARLEGAKRLKPSGGKSGGSAGAIVARRIVPSLRRVSLCARPPPARGEGAGGRGRSTGGRKAANTHGKQKSTGGERGGRKPPPEAPRLHKL